MKKYVLYPIIFAVCVLVLTSVSAGAVQSFADAVSYVENTDGFSINISVDNEGPVTTADRIAVFVLYPEEKDDLADANILYFNSYACNKAQNGIAFSVRPPKNVFGKLPVHICKSSYKGKTQLLKYSYINPNPDVLINAVDDFKAADTVTKVKNCITKYTTGANTVFNSEKLKEICADNVKPDILEKYILLKDFSRDEINTIENVLECFKTALIWQAASSGSDTELKALHDSYAKDVSERLIDYSNEARFLKMFSCIQPTQNDCAAFVKAFNRAAALSFIYNGSNADASYTMEKNSDILFADSDIKLEYAYKRNVTLAEVAAKISKTDIEKHVKSFGEYFKEITDAIVTEKSHDGGTGGSGGGGGGGGGGKSISIPASTTQTVKTVDAEIFSDLKNHAWAKEHIIKLYNAGIISSAKNAAFNPEKNITREEFLKMLVLTAELKTDLEEWTEFSDCTPDRWYYPYVRIAADNGIVSGVGEGLFGAGRDISRQDMAVMCAKVLEHCGKAASGDAVNFADKGEISQYALQSVAQMSSMKIITGFENGNFAPQGFLTRAQAAVVISRIYNCLRG